MSQPGSGGNPDILSGCRLVISAVGPAGGADRHECGGTTGRRLTGPAGVVSARGFAGFQVTHAATVNRLAWMQGAYGLAADDLVLQKTPTGFDVSVWEFFWLLTIGAVLVMAKPMGHQDPAYLAELIQAEQITTVHFVPAMLTAFLNEPLARQCAGLRRVICSGQELTAAVQAKFRAILPVYVAGVQLARGYLGRTALTAERFA